MGEVLSATKPAKTTRPAGGKGSMNSLGKSPRDAVCRELRVGETVAKSFRVTGVPSKNSIRDAVRHQDQ